MSWGDGVQRLDRQRTTPLRKPGQVDRPGPAGRIARGVTGSLTAGLVLLALAMLAAQLLIAEPGPGIGVVTLHLIGAGVAVILQLLADRQRGPAATLSMLGVLATATTVLWFAWLQ